MNGESARVKSMSEWPISHPRTKIHTRHARKQALTHTNARARARTHLEERSCFLLSAHKHNTHTHTQIRARAHTCTHTHLEGRSRFLLSAPMAPSTWRCWTGNNSNIRKKHTQNTLKTRAQPCAYLYYNTKRVGSRSCTTHTQAYKQTYTQMYTQMYAQMYAQIHMHVHTLPSTSQMYTSVRTNTHARAYLAICF